MTGIDPITPLVETFGLAAVIIAATFGAASMLAAVIVAIVTHRPKPHHR